MTNDIPLVQFGFFALIIIFISGLGQVFWWLADEAVFRCLELTGVIHDPAR